MHTQVNETLTVEVQITASQYNNYKLKGEITW